MALRYVARSVVAVPALRSSAPRVSPSAASRPLASRSPQAGYSNWGAARRPSWEDIHELKVRHRADTIMHEIRMKKLKWRLYMGSAALGLGLGVYVAAAIDREAEKIARERDAAREAAREKGTWV